MRINNLKYIFDRNEIPANDNWTVLKERVLYFLCESCTVRYTLFKKNGTVQMHTAILVLIMIRHHTNDLVILGKFTKRYIYAYNIILVFLRVSAYDVHFMILAKKQKNKKKNMHIIRVFLRVHFMI